MSLIGSNNEEKIWNYFKSKGFNDFGIASLMGNLYAESGLNPKNLQNTGNKKLGMTDDKYTKAVDNGTYKNFVKDSIGYGCAQWTYWTRKQNLLNYAKSKNKSIGDLEMQLDFLYKELSEDYKSVLNALKNATSVLQASNAVLLNFEKPADQSVTVQKKRAEYGQVYYDKYAKEEKKEVKKGGTTMTCNVDNLLKIAEGEVGYREKKSNKNLDSKTKNAGFNNYTKYNEVFGVNGCYWCAYYICWLFYTLCGNNKTKAKELLWGTLSGACETLRQAAIKADRYYSTPKVGDLVFFKGTRHAGANHIALVTKVTDSKIYTNEGNTSGSSGVNDNGGEVAEKAYSRNNSKILGYGRTLLTASSKKTTSTDSKIDTVAEVQTWLNKNYNAKLTVDDDYGKKTKTALVKALQKELNETYKPKTKLVVDGIWGSKTKACVKLLKKGDKNDVVKVLQALLVVNGYPKAYVDGSFGEGTASSILSYKKKKKFAAINMNGNAGKVLFESLCK